MKALLLAAALIYQIPLETLDGKKEEITVEDDRGDGTRFLYCKELGEYGVVKGLACKMRSGEGVEFWMYVPAQ